MGCYLFGQVSEHKNGETVTTLLPHLFIFDPDGSVQCVVEF